MRLRLVRMLNALSAATGVYTPVPALCLEVLSWQDLSKPAKGSNQCPDLLLQLRLSKTNLKQPAVQVRASRTGGRDRCVLRTCVMHTCVSGSLSPSKSDRQQPVHSGGSCGDRAGAARGQPRAVGA